MKETQMKTVTRTQTVGTQITRNQVYLEKRLKVILPVSRRKLIDTPRYVATIGKNLENLGYVLSPKLFKALLELNENELDSFYKETVATLKKMRGAHRQFNPMYPNFPQQVIDMSELELYVNAIRHYWSFWLKDAGDINETWLPEYEKEERPPLTEDTKMDLIDLGSEKDFNNIFTVLVEAKSSISESDKQVLQWFFQNYDRQTIVSLLPEKITTKEQLAYVSGLFLQTYCSAEEMSRYVKTPTDVLRIAVGFSGGDVSLAENTKFKKFSRPQRRFLLGLLEVCKTNLEEEMVKYCERWLRLGEVIHPGEYTKQYPRSAKAFKDLRSNKKIATFNSKVEEALREEDVDDAVELLVSRPGEFARRLDHILRSDNAQKAQFSKKFLSVADKVSTNVLLQLFTHFKTRGESDFRAVFPKGNLAKIHVLETAPPVLDTRFCLRLAERIRSVLVNRFSTLDKLGKVYLDENLKTFLVPFSQRSAAKALKTIVRGSQIPLDGEYDTVRFFIWWKNMPDNVKPKNSDHYWGGSGRVDIDLAASILNEDFQHLADVAYYNLKDFAGHHSGDITDAPRGAAEFIDISLDKVLEHGGRYIVMQIYSYTQHAYCDLPECFAGWMGRKRTNSGEIFEAKTVKNKIDIASDTTVCLPLIIDAKERRVIWTDLSLKQRPTWNNARNNAHNVGLICKAMVELRKPNLYDLLSMHVEGRATKIVTDPTKADVVFSSETTPYDVDTILTKFV